MICNIWHYICRYAVCTNKNNIFIIAEFGCLKPKRTVLLVCYAKLFEFFNDFCNGAVCVQSALFKPIIIFDSVLQQIPFKACNVFGKRKINERLAPFAAFCLNIFIAVFCGKALCVLGYICALISVLGHFDAVFVKLKIAHLKRSGKFFDLVAGIVNIEFAADIVAGFFKHCGKAVADCAAACVAYMHGACGIGGNEFHQNFFAFAEIRGTVILAPGYNIFNYFRIISLRKVKIQKARPRNFNLFKKRALQINVIRNTLGNHSRCFFERLCSRKRNV